MRIPTDPYAYIVGNSTADHPYADYHSYLRDALNLIVLVCPHCSNFLVHHLTATDGLPWSSCVVCGHYLGGFGLLNALANPAHGNYKLVQCRDSPIFPTVNVREGCIANRAIGPNPSVHLPVFSARACTGFGSNGTDYSCILAPYSNNPSVARAMLRNAAIAAGRYEGDDDMLDDDETDTAPFTITGNRVNERTPNSLYWVRPKTVTGAMLADVHPYRPINLTNIAPDWVNRSVHKNDVEAGGAFRRTLLDQVAVDDALVINPTDALHILQRQQAAISEENERFMYVQRVGIGSMFNNDIRHREGTSDALSWAWIKARRDALKARLPYIAAIDPTALPSLSRDDCVRLRELENVKRTGQWPKLSSQPDSISLTAGTNARYLTNYADSPYVVQVIDAWLDLARRAVEAGHIGITRLRIHWFYDAPSPNSMNMLRSAYLNMVHAKEEAQQAAMQKDATSDDVPPITSGDMPFTWLAHERRPLTLVEAVELAWLDEAIANAKKPPPPTQAEHVATYDDTLPMSFMQRIYRAIDSLTGGKP